MPGHKGKPLVFRENIETLDFTEIEGTGNLYEQGEPFDQGQALWAEKFGFDNAQLLTGGSTQGVYTALSLALSEGDRVLLDRNCHRSAFHILGLLGCDPIYLQRKWVDRWQIADRVEPEQVEDLLNKHPDIKTICITSPTYYGVLSDIQAISEVCHAHNAVLVVDGAHGAHLPWLGIDHYRGADAVAISAHKTLATLGQSAVLLTNNYPKNEVAYKASLFGTSSPSYPILISLDLARDHLDREGGEHYRKVAARVNTMRNIFPSIKGEHIDQTRLTLLHPQAKEVASQLEQQGIFLEMSTQCHLVAIFTNADTMEDFDRFEQAITPFFQGEMRELGDYAPPTRLPEQILSIRNGILSNKITVGLQNTLGKTAAVPLAPYPPGVPVVAVGEKITQTELDYFSKIGYTNTAVQVVDDTRKGVGK